MDEYVERNFAAGNQILCPFELCRRPVLNAARYAPQTRAKKTTPDVLIKLASSTTSLKRREDQVTRLVLQLTL